MDSTKGRKMTGQTIQKANDHIACRCGNAPHRDGFELTNGNGRPVAESEWTAQSVACRSCGRVLDLHTGRVLGLVSAAWLVAVA